MLSAHSDVASTYGRVLSVACLFLFIFCVFGGGVFLCIVVYIVFVRFGKCAPMWLLAFFMGLLTCAYVGHEKLWRHNPWQYGGIHPFAGKQQQASTI